jgi:hypothetical protein
MTDLDALATLAEAATPGPWKHDDESDYQGLVRIWRDIDPPPVMTMGRVHAADAAYIAAADPTTVKSLIARLHAAEAVCEALSRLRDSSDPMVVAALDAWEATR